jgi:hypothetical protein
MKPTSIDIPVHDIRPLLEIYDDSLYWFMALVAVGFLVLRVLAKQIRMRKKSKEVNERTARYENLIAIDVSNPKAAAYAIGKQGSFFAHDNEETIGVYKTLFERLESYKYAPKVESIDEETLALYRSYQKMIVL